MSILQRPMIISLLVCLTVAGNVEQPPKSLQQEGDKVNYVHTYFNGPESSLRVSRVEIVTGTRYKRGVHNSTTKWPHTIPYVLDPSFTAHGPSVVYTFKRAIQRIMENVCVTYIDVTDLWNRSNTHWFTDNGYQSNAYILFKDGGRCWSGSGQGNGIGGKQTSPCYDFVTNIHEVFHTLGASHTHQTKRRDNYITINQDDISPGLKYNYLKFEEATFVDMAFDPMSVLMYSNAVWTRNGLETFTPIRDDIFDANVSKYSDATLLYELSQVYRCQDHFCNTSQVDCDPGYYTPVSGICRCVCPSELDPDTKCKRLLNKASTSAQWPNTPIVVLAGGPNNTCPSGFDHEVGWLSFDGIWPTLQKPVPVKLPVNKKTIYLPFCTKRSPNNTSEIDWESWPAGGRYCIVKPKGANCGGFFMESTLAFQSLAPVQQNGSIGDTIVSGKNITLKLCCKNKEPKLLAIEVPNKDPFRLVSQGGCPKFKGLREYEALVDLYTKVKNVSGSVLPKHAIFSNELQVYQCYYLPPVYGCNQGVTLTRETPSVTLTTPGFGTTRESNRRCFYNFTIPANAQVRITFTTYDLHASDYLLVKRYHKWQEPHRISNEKWPAQFVSEGEYLSMEYWSSWEITDRQGINFTADVLLPEDSCYNLTSKGDDYIGKTSATETYEDCLPWSQAVDCLDFPDNGMNPIWLLLSGNKCRNPGGQLIQPWCYTYKNGSNCHKRYCDVCNTKTPIDVIKNCTLLVRDIPDFCSNAIEKFGCFKTCGFTEAPITRWCNRDWIQHGERCFQVYASQLNARNAEKACKRQGPNGTLFQIRDIQDLELIRHYMQKMGHGYSTSQWISGEFRPNNGKWYFTDSDVQMTYFNWSSKYLALTSDMKHDCVRLIGEYNTDKGGWRPVSCSSTGDRFSHICQVNSIDEPCSDRLSTPVCEQLLASVPSFCGDNRFQNIASQNCRKSCGVCKPELGQLTSQNVYCNPDTDTTVMSGNNTIRPGQVMTFTCSPGLFLHSGNLKRACSSSGNLLGSPPVCRAYPAARDIKLNAVRKRNSALPQRRAFLFLEDSYRILFDGHITKWYYYCKNPGIVYFLVYRPLQSRFSFVGSNNVTCDTDRVRSFYVPVEDQISVRQHDVVGLYSSVAGTVATTSCTLSTDKIAKVVQVTANSFTLLQNSSFSLESCLFASVGYHLEPFSLQSRVHRH